MPIANPRIFLTGTGGQGTLTATRLLGEAAMSQDIQVIMGEVHGMAQRGGVVESSILLGGWRAARIDYGEADILVGFEALETLRALPYLKKGGHVFGSAERLPPLSASLGQADYPDMETIKNAVAEHAGSVFFMDCHEAGVKAGNAKAANTSLLGALCASGLLPFGLSALESAITEHLPEKIRSFNLEAMRLGALAWELSCAKASV